MKSNLNLTKYYIFLVLIVIFSIPFYILGAFFPISGLPFGLPISFLMIFVPFTVALIYAWIDDRAQGIKYLLAGVIDWRKSERWSLMFSFLCIIIVSLLSFYTMKFFSMNLPSPVNISLGDLPLMFILYFLGAIPEEVAWTSILTKPFTKRYHCIIAGCIIGFVWAVWHIIPWSWAHPVWWIIGMIILNLLWRISMVYTYSRGGGSLFNSLVFHMMINVCIGVFPNTGSHFNPWIYSIWMLPLITIQIFHFKNKDTLHI